MTDWNCVLSTIAPHGKPTLIEGFAAAMPEIIRIADLSTPQRQAHFLAQCAHESDGLHTVEEYASGRAYEGREDLGNTEPGDGVRFKGRGVIQLTGRANYEEYGGLLRVNLVSTPQRAGQAPYCYLTAAYFWKQKGLNVFADRDDVKTVTKRINGGTNGLDSRMGYLRRAKAALRSGTRAVGLIGVEAEPPKTMASSKTGWASIATGAGGIGATVTAAQPLLDGAQSAKDAAGQAAGLLGIDGRLAILAGLALVIVVGAAFIWWDRRRKLYQDGV